jgi:hypothetical protein
MDQHDQRMECLRMAFELGGKAEPVVSAAQQLLDFVAGKPSAGESRAEPATAAPAASAPEQQEPPAASASPADDAIAACGTVLVMPEGGGLEDAVQSVEPAAAAIEEQGAAEAVSAATTQDATAEAAAVTGGSEAQPSEVPVSEAQVSGDAAATQESSTSDVAVPDDPDIAAGEHLAAPPAPEAEPDQPKADATAN